MQFASINCGGQDSAGTSVLGFHGTKCALGCAETHLEGLAFCGCLYSCPGDKVKALTWIGRSFKPLYKTSTLNLQKPSAWNNSRNVFIFTEQKKKNENIKNTDVSGAQLGVMLGVRMGHPFSCRFANRTQCKMFARE